MTLQMDRPVPPAQEVIQEPATPPHGFEPSMGGGKDECDFCSKDAKYRCRGHHIILDAAAQKEFKVQRPECISKVCEAHYHQFKSHGHNYQRI